MRLCYRCPLGGIVATSTRLKEFQQGILVLFSLASGIYQVTVPMAAEEENAMPSTPKPKLGHVGIFVRDLDKMVDFYTRVMGLTISDRGAATTSPLELVFMSSDPSEHHQFVLVTGRPDYANFSVAQQVSFVVESLDELRTLRDRVEAEGLEISRTATHGNAWSIYYNDPEGNRIENYVHTPWHIPQPHVHPLDLSLSNDEIMRMTKAHCQEDPGFMPVAEREKVLARMIESTE